MIFKETMNMTDKNAMRYVLSQLKKHGKKQENHCELLTLTIENIRDYCDYCRHEDFGMCGLRHKEDEEISHICIENAIKILEYKINKR